MPRDHVRREALPWQPALNITECGRTIDPDRMSTMSRAQFRPICREWNELEASYRRARMAVPSTVVRPNVCMTCWETCVRWPSWEAVPIRTMYRWLDDFGWYPEGPAARRACQELWALGRLAARHPAEFADLIAEMKDGYRRGL